MLSAAFRLTPQALRSTHAAEPEFADVSLSAHVQGTGPRPADAAALQRGKIVQAMDAGTYTYLELATDKGNLWVAAPKMEAKVGATVRFETGVEMRDFESPTLKRTFDSIYFVTGVETVTP